MPKPALLAICTVLLPAAACQPVQPPSPATLGRSTVSLDGRRDPFRGGAVSGRCLDQIHVFLASGTTPRASFTIHPMGTGAVGRHPLKPANDISPDRDPGASAGPGPFLLDGVLPPELSIEADSGYVELAWDSEGRLRGKLEAWILAPDSASSGPRAPVSPRRLTGTFLAYRNASLEPNLIRGVDCAR